MTKPTFQEWSDLADEIAQKAMPVFEQKAIEQGVLITSSHADLVLSSFYALSLTTMQQMGRAVLQGVDITLAVSPETVIAQRESGALK